LMLGNRYCENFSSIESQNDSFSPLFLNPLPHPWQQ
jgi:hypothetical protein